MPSAREGALASAPGSETGERALEGKRQKLASTTACSSDRRQQRSSETTEATVDFVKAELAGNDASHDWSAPHSLFAPG